MDEIVRELVATFREMWSKRWIGIGVASIVAVLGGIGVLFYQERYQASAKVFVDTDSVLRPLMKDLAFQPDIDQKVAILARTLISRPNVERLLQNSNAERSMSPELFDKEVDKLMHTIQVSSGGKGNLYQITYRDANPKRAGDIVESLVNRFVESGIGDNKRDSMDARHFLDEQIRSHEAKLTEAENKLKDFKLQHFGLTGTSSQDHFTRISQLSDEVSKARTELASAEQARDALRHELAREDPQLPPEAMAQMPGAQPNSADVRLDALKRQLDDLLRRYTDDHPDVTATKRAIAQIEQQKRQDAQARASSTDGSSRMPAATSPVYQRIRVELAQAEAKVAELRGRVAAEQMQLDQIRATAGRVPEVEAQLTQLNRDYEVIRKNYEQLVSRRESAAMGERIGDNSQDAVFRLIEPTRVSPTPVFPNRTMLALMVFVLSVALGLATILGVMRLMPTCHSTRALAEMSGRPVLGTVSMSLSVVARRDERRERLRFIAVALAFLGVQVIWLAWLASRAKT